MKDVKFAGSAKLESGQKTIIHDLLERDMPACEKSMKRIAQEAANLVSAGSTTTVHFLKTTIYFILANPAIHKRLRVELEEAIPHPSQTPSLHVVEKLTSLSAVVKEGSRMTNGTSSRLSRIAPNQDFTFREWILPAGTSISMSHIVQHRNAEVFPEQDEFRPERWLDPQSSRKLDRYLVNFGRGSRSCLGINLMKFEMDLT